MHVQKLAFNIRKAHNQEAPDPGTVPGKSGGFFVFGLKGASSPPTGVEVLVPTASLNDEPSAGEGWAFTHQTGHVHPRHQVVALEEGRLRGDRFRAHDPSVHIQDA